MGVRIESNSDFVLMTGNIFEGCTTYGVSINDAPSTENTIIGNTFIDCDTNIQDAGTSTYTQANNSAWLKNGKF